MEDTSTQTETGGETAWSYNEGVAGTGNKPEWFKDSKYTSIAAQAQAYGDLESKLGGFTGSPDEYSFNEGMEADSGRYDALRELGKKHNMSNELYNEIVSMHTGQESADHDANMAREIEGLGDNGQQRIDNVNDYLKANVSDAFREMLGNAVQTAGDVEELEGFINGLKGQPLAPANVTTSKSSYTQEGLEELMFATNERGQRLSSLDDAHRVKVKEYIDKMNK